MKLYSLIINWRDRDWEQGTYATTVAATGDAHAEALARGQMQAVLAEERGCDVDEIDDEFGSLVECGRGAYWRAADLEQALRDVLGHPTNRESVLRAEVLLAQLDRYGEE
jgi:phage terminase large subunit-like protein